MSGALYYSIRNPLKTALALLFVFSMLTACSTPDERRRDEAGSTIPWNQPEPWEESPNLTAPISW